jgi:hypothetical protein
MTAFGILNKQNLLQVNISSIIIFISNKSVLKTKQWLNFYFNSGEARGRASRAGHE